ncbi:MAG: hypothetical protein JNL52_10340 [Flavobacteriales bacterium]|nr:hypothetical protein [Flavobacteriales bacterium]
MRGTFQVGLLMLFVACRPEGSTTTAGPKSDLSDTTVALAIEDTANAWDPSENMVDLFMTIADTGRNYAVLHRQMQMLALVLPAEIDTMGRYYDPIRDSIMLPLDDEDEVYAGQYYPRRFEGKTLSIEYLDQYDATAAPGTMALVTGLWASDQQGDSAIEGLLKHMPRAYRVQARAYQGCMH